MDILPFLHLKKQQARLALKLINSTRFGIYGNGRKKPLKLKRYHESLYLKNKQLNSKNSGTRLVYALRGTQ
jgi:hypothetical protein